MPSRPPSPDARSSDTSTSPGVKPEQLAQQARRLAHSHLLAARQGRDRLLVQLGDNERVFQEAYNRLKRVAAEPQTLPPAGLWLVENFSRVKELIRSARRDLRTGHRRELPYLCGTAGEGLPRVYHLAWELVTHLDAQLDQESLHQFFSAYQTVSPLNLTELWSVCGMLRLGLIEFLCRVAIRVAPPQPDRELVRPAVEHDVRQEAGDELSMKHAILSLRDLAMLDWKEFVERQSAVEDILREDPAGIYPRMSFAGRDHYRRIIQQLARCSALDEEQVARAVIGHARKSAATAAVAVPARAGGRATVEQHVGYYLVDQGRAALEAGIGYHPTWSAALRRLIGRAPLTSYLGAILFVWLLTVAGTAVLGVRLEIVRIAGPAAALLLLALFGGAAGQYAVSLVNWLCNLLVPPRPIMRLDFSAGIPVEHRTLVAIPALLTSERTVRDLVEQLELRYLANQDDNLWFALLSDFPDADQETVAGDPRLLELARTEIERLNERYCADRPGVFYLLHRPRKWSRQQGAWMGEERKRGKLAALNRLLRTGEADVFSATIGDLPQLRSVRYVITLDSDTRLPRDAGRELVGCAAHPLNQAEIDPHSRMVVAGYAVLQPRVTATMPEAHRSHFSRLVAGDAGIDPYTLQTSDLYHDLFGQGSFIGKGIYDVEAFESVCEGRFPENRLLSHDLIEGCFARSGLVNDVELFEGVPSRLLVDMNRRQRWIRGDWQIASWLWGRVPTLRGTAANPLSGLSRWKILDNLRRSLTPLLLWSFLLSGWLLAPALAGTCTLLALALVFGPAGIAALAGVLRRPEGKPWMLHAKDEARQYLRT
ncbi:MAG: glycosyltransferase family 2 protein, partial [Thermoguttaceae bacterium]